MTQRRGRLLRAGTTGMAELPGDALLTQRPPEHHALTGRRARYSTSLTCHTPAAMSISLLLASSCQAGVRLPHFYKIECHRAGLTQGLPGRGYPPVSGIHRCRLATRAVKVAVSLQRCRPPAALLTQHSHQRRPVFT